MHNVITVSSWNIGSSKYRVFTGCLFKSMGIGKDSNGLSAFFTGKFEEVWAGSFFVISNELSSGELLSFYALIGYFTGPASSLITANRSIHDALIAADRLFEIIDLETEATNETKMELSRDQIGDIECNELSFRYGNRTSVFNDLNLRIKKGASTAIVGESGSGKSTLLSLLQNLYPLQSGNITIGGLDLQYISNRSLRQLVGVVPQQIDLFSGTILENIAIGDPEPDLGRILFLAKLLGIDEFIEKLPNTYNSVVVEQGTNFSGGQKQRLAIARALYRNPEILILDEATSSLDPANEQKVQETLGWFKAQGKTIILIAHRLSTIRNCDQILVLNKGKLVEQGRHFELLEQEGHYARLWEYNAASTLQH